MLCLIVNPRSGGGRALQALPSVLAQLGREGCDHRVEFATGLPHAGALARTAALAGEMPVAFGGDGLVATVANATRDTGAVMGVLPAGRGNDFARYLGVPLDPVRATAVLATGEPRCIDMGAVGDRAFLGIATCGFDSDANRIANRTRYIGGRFVYVYAGLRALARWQPSNFALRVDGTAHELFGYTVAVANSGMHGGGMLLAPGASLQDGRFDVVMIAAASKPRFLSLLPSVYRGRHINAHEVSVLSARTVELDAERPFTLYADGEEMAALPVTLRVLPAAVGVMAPAGDAPTLQRCRA